MSTITLNNRLQIVRGLSRDPALTGNPETALRKIGQTATKVLGIDEVRIWNFSQSGESLTAVSTYKAGQKTPVKPKHIRARQVQSYLNTVQNSLFLAVLDSSRKVKNSRMAQEFLRQEIRASLHVPLYVRGALIGAMEFNQIRKERSWTISDHVLACEIADLTANVLQSFGLKGIEKHTPDIVPMLDLVLDQVLSEVNLEHGVIRLDEIPVVRGYSAEIEMEFVNQYRASPDLVQRTVVVPNLARVGRDARTLVNVLKSAEVGAFITVPMLIDENQVGCVHIASRDPVEWKEDTIALLEWTARHIARVVDDLWTRQDNLTLSKLIQSFHSSARDLNRMMVFDEAVQAVGNSATQVLETDVSCIVLRNPDGTIDCPWISGLNVDRINRIIDTEGASIDSILRRIETPILFPDIRSSILPTSLQKQLIEKKVRSSRIFPLVYEDQTMGAIFGFYKHMRLFTRNERRILSLFANSAALTLQNAWMYDKVEQGYLGLALALANAEDAREVTIPDSSMRSAKLAAETARSMKVPEEEVESIHWAALLHDIGKKDIPESILKKSGPLDETEWEMVRLSPTVGERMLAPVPQLHGIARIIRNFHEHFDGSGYPDRLKGDQIPIGAKVLAVTDAYTSMLDKRAYREPRPPQDALHEIQRYSGKYFDPKVVNAFCTVVEKHIT
ncbi:MAG: HD domain-containing phosphohydrolase [Chloroflexota bacterium]